MQKSTKKWYELTLTFNSMSDPEVVNITELNEEFEIEDAGTPALYFIHDEKATSLTISECNGEISEKFIVRLDSELLNDIIKKARNCNTRLMLSPL